MWRRGRTTNHGAPPTHVTGPSASIVDLFSLLFHLHFLKEANAENYHRFLLFSGSCWRNLLSSPEGIHSKSQTLQLAPHSNAGWVTNFNAALYYQIFNNSVWKKLSWFLAAFWIICANFISIDPKLDLIKNVKVDIFTFKCWLIYQLQRSISLSNLQWFSLKKIELIFSSILNHFYKFHFNWLKIGFDKKCQSWDIWESSNLLQSGEIRIIISTLINSHFRFEKFAWIDI